MNKIKKIENINNKISQLIDIYTLVYDIFDYDLKKANKNWIRSLVKRIKDKLESLENVMTCGPSVMEIHKLELFFVSKLKSITDFPSNVIRDLTISECLELLGKVIDIYNNMI